MNKILIFTFKAFINRTAPLYLYELIEQQKSKTNTRLAGDAFLLKLPPPSRNCADTFFEHYLAYVHTAQPILHIVYWYSLATITLPMLTQPRQHSLSYIATASHNYLAYVDTAQPTLHIIYWYSLATITLPIVVLCSQNCLLYSGTV